MRPEVSGCIRNRGADKLIDVRVQPRAARNSIGKVVDARLRIRTTAPPADGKANAAVTRLLARYLGVPPSRLELVRGHTHRDKCFLIRGE